MKNKTAKALAIVALVFMGIFIVMLMLTIVDHTMLNGAVGYLALGTGVFALMIFIALKADGRGFSMTKINNELEMKKIEEELEKKKKEEEQIEEEQRAEEPEKKKEEQCAEDQDKIR